MKKRPLTEEEIKNLNNHLDLTIPQIMKFLPGRTYWEIYNFLSTNGFVYNQKNKHWYKTIIVSDLDVECDLDFIICPICHNPPVSKIHLHAKYAQIIDCNPNYLIKDEAVKEHTIDFSEADMKLFPPYSYSFTCENCKVNILIEKN